MRLAVSHAWRPPGNQRPNGTLLRGSSGWKGGPSASVDDVRASEQRQGAADLSCRAWTRVRSSITAASDHCLTSLRPTIYRSTIYPPAERVSSPNSAPASPEHRPSGPSPRPERGGCAPARTTHGMNSVVIMGRGDTPASGRDRSSSHRSPDPRPRAGACRRPPRGRGLPRAVARAPGRQGEPRADERRRDLA